MRQKLEGDGTVFLAGTGTIVQKILAEGETILADTNCVMAFAKSCKMDLRRAGGVLGILGGGEGHLGHITCLNRMLRWNGIYAEGARPSNTRRTPATQWC